MSLLPESLQQGGKALDYHGSKRTKDDFDDDSSRVRSINHLDVENRTILSRSSSLGARVHTSGLKTQGTHAGFIKQAGDRTNIRTKGDKSYTSPFASITGIILIVPADIRTKGTKGDIRSFSFTTRTDPDIPGDIVTKATSQKEIAMETCGQLTRPRAKAVPAGSPQIPVTSLTFPGYLAQPGAGEQLGGTNCVGWCD